jgi:hypothetical protein
MIARLVRSLGGRVVWRWGLREKGPREKKKKHTVGQQPKKVDCGKMLVNCGSGAGWKKGRPSYGQNGQMVQSWGLVHHYGWKGANGVCKLISQIRWYPFFSLGAQYKAIIKSSTFIINLGHIEFYLFILFQPWLLVCKALGGRFQTFAPIGMLDLGSTFGGQNPLSYYIL